jgi:hypothetical protein
MLHSPNCFALPAPKVCLRGLLEKHAAQQVKILSTMSANRDASRKAIDSTTARGNTALYDALYASIDAVKETRAKGGCFAE